MAYMWIAFIAHQYYQPTKFPKLIMIYGASWMEDDFDRPKLFTRMCRKRSIGIVQIPQSDRIESFNYRDCSNHRTVFCTSSVHTHTVSVQFILSIIMFWLERWSEIRCYTPILISCNSFFPPYCVFFPWMWCTFNVCMHCYYSKREEKSHTNPCCHIISSIRLISFISDVIVQYFLYLSVWASQ